MALTPFSLLLRLRSSSSSSSSSKASLSLYLRRLKTQQFLLPSYHGVKPFSTSHSSLLQPQLDNDPPPPDPRTSLSSRMAFVFDQMDAIDRERSSKDEALQRIRTWHQKKQQQQQQQQQPDNADGVDVSEAKAVAMEGKQMGEEEWNLFKKEVELIHPWPEWIELMERLVQQNYFDHRRVDEDRMVENLPVDLSGIKEDMGFDFTRDWTTVRTACLNFGRDRFDILKSLSRKDLQILVGHGCPSLDLKVVFSAKLLRKHVHLDEGDVCSSCCLRSSCGRGYLLTRKEDEARTIDVMRILSTYGFDSVIGSVENKPLMKMKSVKTVVRKLLHEVVKLSAVPIDPNLPPPVIKKPPPKVKQPPPPPKKRVGRDDIEMKKGDWLCPKCDFMNFAKNIVCLQCDAKRPKRQLLPGEWECPECNFLNYRRNMACFHCDHKRPPDEFTENQRQEKQQYSGTRLQRAARMPSVSNAWNFDFDDNESDGADVAAFEFADPPKMGDGSSLDGPPRGGITRGFEDDPTETITMSCTPERGKYFSERNERKPSSHASRTGFDDFDEEDDDDDVDSYELDMQNSSPTHEVSSKKFSKLENTTESEDFDDFEHYSKPHYGVKASLSGSDDGEQGFDSDSDLLDHPHLKSSHIADSRQWTRGRGVNSPRKGMSFGSDDDLELNSDSDDDVDQGFRSKQRKGRQQSSGRKGSGRGGSSDSEDELLLDSESDGDDGLHSRINMRGNKGGPNRRGSTFRGHNQSDSLRSAPFRTDDRRSRRNSFGKADDDRSSRGSYRNGRGSSDDRSFKGSYRSGRGSSDDRSFEGSYRNSRGSSDDRSFKGSYRNGRGSSDDRSFRGSSADGYGGGRGNDRGTGLRGNRPPQRDQFESRQRGGSSQFNDGSRGFSDERPRRRIIER